MKLFFHQTIRQNLPIEEELSKPNLKEDIEKTRYALETAYAGFDNALEQELIDSYIYEINSLLKRYNHLISLSNMENLSETTITSSKKTPIQSLVSQVFG